MDKNTLPMTRRGWRFTVIDTNTDTEVVSDSDKEEYPVMGMSEDVPYASVGMSVTVGRSEKFAAKKLEISAWCTLPAEPDPDSIDAAYEEAYKYVTEKAEEKWSDAMNRFFGEQT